MVITGFMHKRKRYYVNPPLVLPTIYNQQFMVWVTQHTELGMSVLAETPEELHIQATKQLADNYEFHVLKAKVPTPFTNILNNIISRQPIKQ